MAVVPRHDRFFAAGFAALALVAFGVAGCGGGDSSSSSQTAPGAASQKKPPASAETPPPRLRTSDRKTYASIQRISGDLRAAVTPLAYGTAQTLDTTALASDARTLDRLTPRSAELQGLRQQTLSALQSVIGRAPTKAIATAAIGEADRIDDGLRRYAASNPAANEIAPG